MHLPPVLRLLSPETLKFGLVGSVNFAVDVGLFNLLRLGVLQHRPVTAAVLSTATAAVSSYFMNRHWTWRHRARTGTRRELPLFLLLSAAGLAISTGCLAVSHYLLGFRGLLADNIAKNGVGLVVGMVWRFWSFRRWVFLAPPHPQQEPSAAQATVRTAI